MTGFYLYLNSSDSKTVRPNNTFHDFTIELPHERFFNLGQWTVALTEITLTGHKRGNRRNSLPEALVVLTDIAQDSYIREALAPVLRTIPSETDLNASLFQSYYVGVNALRFDKIRIFLKNSNLDSLELTKWGPIKSIILRCTLHFQEVHRI